MQRRYAAITIIVFLRDGSSRAFADFRGDSEHCKKNKKTKNKHENEKYVSIIENRARQKGMPSITAEEKRVAAAR